MHIFRFKDRVRPKPIGCPRVSSMKNAFTTTNPSSCSFMAVVASMRKSGNDAAIFFCSSKCSVTVIPVIHASRRRWGETTRAHTDESLFGPIDFSRSVHFASPPLSLARQLSLQLNFFQSDSIGILVFTPLQEQESPKLNFIGKVAMSKGRRQENHMIFGVLPFEFARAMFAGSPRARANNTGSLMDTGRIFRVNCPGTCDL